MLGIQIKSWNFRLSINSVNNNWSHIILVFDHSRMEFNSGIQLCYIWSFQIQFLYNRTLKQTVLTDKMDGSLSTPDAQTYPISQSSPRILYQQLISHAEQMMIQRAIQCSQQEQIRRVYSNKNQLEPKYRKMIPNLKMKKSHQECTVCLEKYTEGEIIKQLPCNHILHRECAKQWLKINKSCPVCRFDLEAHFKKVQAQQNKQGCEKIHRKVIKV